ncbi:MAG: hypothetical protein J0M30_07075 [Chitinophagales bacterium]|nr:hypothetical protein [Chitinophagales bacterium]
MIIWSGYGFLVFIVVFINSLLANLITTYLTKEDSFYQTNLIPLGISFLFSAVVIKLFAEYFNKLKSENKGTRIFDQLTIAGGDQNKLFFIPFRFWTPILACLGFVLVSYQLLAKK